MTSVLQQTFHISGSGLILSGFINGMVVLFFDRLFRHIGHIRRLRAMTSPAQRPPTSPAMDPDRWKRQSTTLLHLAAVQAGIFHGDCRAYARNLHSPTPESAGLIEQSVLALESGILLKPRSEPTPTGSVPKPAASSSAASPATAGLGGGRTPAGQFLRGIGHRLVRAVRAARDQWQADGPVPPGSGAAGLAPTPATPCAPSPMGTILPSTDSSSHGRPVNP